MREVRSDLQLGFRRIDEVRVTLTATGTRAEVSGVVHRLPHTIAIPLRTATRLVHAGAPLVVIDESASESDAPLGLGHVRKPVPEHPAGRGRRMVRRLHLLRMAAPVPTVLGA